MAIKCPGTNFQGKKGVRSCNTYKKVKLLEHAMKILERMLERRVQELVNNDSIQFGFMSGRGTTDALFVVQRMQEEYKNKKKSVHVFCEY